MSQKRYYRHCPDCGTRMRRTGKKERESVIPEHVRVYLREYECPGCGQYWLFSENKALFWRGSFVSE